MIDRLEYRDGMARLAAAVNVVTTDGPAGRAGLTASAICSVTDDPPTLLACVNRSSRCAGVIRRNGVLCVNVLGAEHQDLSCAFAKLERDLERCFTGWAWRPLETGAPALVGAVAVFDCEIRTIEDVGTHCILLCEVRGMCSRPEGAGLVYFDRAYHAIGTADAERRSDS